jgi:hypothetical protein
MTTSACSETPGPGHQSSPRTAQRHNGGVPHEYVRRLEIRAMQLQHSHTAQTGKCAGYQSGRNRIHRETTPQH